MFARVTTIRGSADRMDEMDEAIRNYQAQAVPTVQSQSGFKGTYLLVDRQSGKALAITLWESEQAMQQSESAVAQLRAQAAQQVGGGEPTVEHYEVAVQI
jgi:heme-degrading monooxygenase HmoA